MKRTIQEEDAGVESSVASTDQPSRRMNRRVPPQREHGKKNRDTKSPTWPSLSSGKVESPGPVHDTYDNVIANEVARLIYCNESVWEPSGQAPWCVIYEDRKRNEGM